MKTARALSGSDLAEHYRALLAEQARSELSVTEFAGEVGLSAATLYAWRRRLSGSRAQDREPGRELLEVQIADGERPAARPSPVVLTVDGRLRIELEADFDDGALERLLRLLSRC
jgi:transposase-like protein